VQNSASALAGLGRSLLWARSYRNAHKVYTELNQKHGHLRNRSGHPYGILTAIQLYEIDLNQNQEENGLKILIDVYEKIRNGVWTLEFSAYDFFITEIKSILDSRLNDDRFLDIQEKYLTLQNKPSPYQEELQFIEYLKNEAVPHIKERRSLLGREEKAPHHRFLISSGNEYHLISYCELSSSQMLNRSYGGFSWDMDSIKTALLPKILDEVKKNSGLQIKLIDEEKKETPSADKETVLEKSLTLPFREFLLPWKILISQPAFDVLERTARRENFFYGVLIIVIVVLMLLGALLIVRDISRKSETARLKTEFVHNVSHELKTPLTLIRLYGETLQRKRNLTNTERHESYEIITKESERLSHMINNILDFSRIEMGKKIFDFKRGDLESVIRDTLESYRYHLEKKGFSIKEEITSGLPEISFDKEDMAGVLINLLSNAMKFSPEKKNVTVKLFKEKSMVVLQVADEGIGISPEDQSKIFERFYRSKHKIVNESKGSGLGLTLVKHIVDAHSGKIKIESEPGKGAVISICLPIPLSNKDKEK
jgi:signal transduction histidine kinase